MIPAFHGSVFAPTSMVITGMIATDLGNWSKLFAARKERVNVTVPVTENEDIILSTC